MYLKDPRFIIISGTKRNVGKTTLACQLIKELSKSKPTYALKWIVLDSNKPFLHAHHQQVNTYSIEAETAFNSGKDTALMKQSGATESWLVVSTIEYVEVAISEILKLIPQNSFVIVESASLRHYIDPSLFLIINRQNSEPIKPYIKDLLPLADLLIDDILLPETLPNVLNLLDLD